MHLLEKGWCSSIHKKALELARVLFRTKKPTKVGVFVGSLDLFILFCHLG